jgi:hypothetical protein
VSAGLIRIGLDGQAVGVATADEAEDAAKRLVEYMAGTAKQPVEAPPQKPVGEPKPVEASKPVEVEPPPIKSAPAATVEPQIAKRRLGLADPACQGGLPPVFRPSAFYFWVLVEL